MARETKGEAAKLAIAKENYKRGFNDGLRQAPLDENIRNPDMASSARSAMAFQEIISRGDGWLRVTSDENGKTVFMKYKFTSGPHEGHYVMFVGVPGAGLSDLLEGLLWKVRDADRGTLRPTMDTIYGK
jgi:hypothetical protein